MSLGDLDLDPSDLKPHQKAEAHARLAGNPASKARRYQETPMDTVTHTRQLQQLNMYNPSLPLCNIQQGPRLIFFDLILAP
ncbi:hypothetical protein DPMN_000572 [Dreissena polymorpha]|uniref:Uncharacterized protein n=1 Tax=Dreissena polymorpha TaxID=45954 RepID=A0A9D4MGX7_DREPO|nr:hypothetical protein DPMN_000572 [Dreissena polymorpha]